MRSTLGWSLAVSLGVLLPCAALALEARVLTAADIATLGGTDLDGGAGDLLLRNDKIEAVILAPGVTPDFGIPFAAEGLPSRGVIVDAGTVGDKNDQLNEIHQILNLDGKSFLYYLGPAEGFPAPVLGNDGTRASITVSGIALLDPVSSFSSPTLMATTTYSVEVGKEWIELTTEVRNLNPFPVPVFSIADVDILAGRGRLPFQPFPNRGTKPPPLDLFDPFPALGVWPYIVLAGTNRPADGPATGLEPSGEVSYTFVADSPLSPFIGAADWQAAAVGSTFDLAAVGAGNPPNIDPGATLTFHRKLIITKSNSVESGVNVAMPLLYGPSFGGLDARAEFKGRVVDGQGHAIADAHLVLDNTVPGAPDYRPLVTVLDENQDGEPDGAIPATPGAALPTTHIVTGPDGRFLVRLQALLDPSSATTVYRGRIQAPERGTMEIGPLNVNLATILAGSNDLGDIVLSDTGTFEFKVLDATNGAPLPAKLTFYGVAGTENPDFGSQYLSLRNFSGLSKAAGDGLDPVTADNSKLLAESFSRTPALNVALTANGSGAVQLKPGKYKVYASRGLEYTLDTQTITVQTFTTRSKTFRLRRVINTSGFVSMDFHTHSANSFDASVPLKDRVISLAASGIDVFVASDHDTVTDAAPVVSLLGLDDRIAAIPGIEASGGFPVPAHPVATGGVNAFPEGIGHYNAWPLSPVPGSRRHGAPSDEFLNPGTLIDRLRGMDSLALLGVTPDTAGIEEWLAAAQAGVPGTVGESLPADPEVVILNHPRAGLDGLVVVGLFNSLANAGGDPALGGYDPTQLITDFPNSLLALPSLYNQLVVGAAGTLSDGLSFDAIELINGGGAGQYLKVRRDWFSLLDQGLNKTGVADSDSHRVVLESAGYGRSFVASSTDDPRAADANELATSVKAMRLVGTTGPFIRFTARTPGGPIRGLGEVVDARPQRPVLLRIRVEAAPWIPVEQVRIYRNGSLVAKFKVDRSDVLGSVVRFDRTVRCVGIQADSYLTVEAGMRLDANGDPQSPELLGLLRAVEPGVTPFGFTNPIFVDADGGGYTPPGLRASASRAEDRTKLGLTLERSTD